MYPDFLTCGLCADEFPLSQILDFIVHKTSCLQARAGQSLSTGDPAVSSQQTLSCYFCQQDFHTARGILHHIQFSHRVEIVQQKTPWSSLLDHGQQATSTPLIPLSPHAADNRPAPTAATATTVSNSHSTVVSHIPNEVSVSSAKEAAMPVTCAKLASTEGTTICCNGKECQVTINPPRPQTPPPPKKCCSSVVPKKRTRHMQEHDSEDMEQCALETLCSLGGQLFVSQKSKPGGHKRAKKASKSSRKRKAQCILSCERERVCVTKASEESESEAKEEERCQTCEEAEEEKDGECHGADSVAASSSSKPTESRVEIYSVEKDSITSRKTVIMNSGMTVTVQPTESAESSRTNSGSPVFPASQSQGRSIPSEDASRESAHILAELMYHATHPGDQVPIHNLQTTAADSHVQAVSDGGLQSALSDPAVSDLLPLDPNISTADAVNFSNSLCPMFMNSSVPTSLELPVSMPGSSASLQGGMDQPLDMQHLPDLDALTAAIQHFPALDHLSSHAAVLPMPHVPVPSGSNNSSFGSGEDDSEGRKGAGGKKRRYPTSRPYKCSECDQAFNQPIHLKKHMSKHTGVKPFKCDLCQYSTVERSHLKAHNRIHTGEKPFQCPFCSYATAQNSTLKVHLRRHHQDRQTGSMGSTTTTTTSAKDR